MTKLCDVCTISISTLKRERSTEVKQLALGYRHSKKWSWDEIWTYTVWPKRHSSWMLFSANSEGGRLSWKLKELSCVTRKYAHPLDADRHSCLPSAHTPTAFSQHLEQCQAHDICLRYMDWMNKYMNKWFLLHKLKNNAIIFGVTHSDGGAHALE